MAASTTIGVTNTLVGGSQGPATVFPLNCAVITPSDTDTFTLPTALKVVSAGTVVVTPYGQQTDLTIVVSAAMIPYVLEVMVRAVKSTGTTGAIVLHGIW